MNTESKIEFVRGLYPSVWKYIWESGRVNKIVGEGSTYWGFKGYTLPMGHCSR